MTACAGPAEALRLGDGIGDRRKIENLVPILGLRRENDLATTGAADIRKVALDLLHVRLWDPLAGIPHMAGLGSALLVGGLALRATLGLAGQPILAGRGR